MKVLFQSYYDFGRMYGGGPTVVYSLADELRQIGVDVTFHDYWKHDPSHFDVIHYFSSYDNSNWLRHRENDPPLVVTPISYFAWPLTKRIEMGLKYYARVLRHRTTNRRRLGYTFQIPAHFFPNSEGEAHYLSEAYHVPREKMTIVPHGVARTFEQGDPTLFERRYGLRDFVLCVGRFEYPRKNQHTLIKAMRNEKVPLVFIGGPDAGFAAYYEQCRREAGAHAHFLAPIKHDDPLLSSAYHACKVLVMPALLESPGLTGLEAALAGANAAVTSGGSTREYFGEHAWYFDPRDVKQMRNAICAAHAAPKNGALHQRVLEKYTWPAIAKVQMQAYEEVIRRHRGQSCRKT